MIKIKSNFIYELFIATIFLTEFYYINIGDGVARIYHFFSILIILGCLSARSINALLRSKVFLSLMLFLFINIIAVFLSDSPKDAGVSLLSFAANIAVAIAISLMLITNKVTLDRLVKLILTFTVISIVWSLVQIFAFNLGVILALSEQQESQVLIGFGPGFRTEANTFGKFLIFPFLLFLPYFLNRVNDDKLRFSYFLMIVAMLLNFTRSSIMGLSIAFLYVFIWHTGRKNLHIVAQRVIQISALLIFVLTLIFSGLLTMSDYGKYKIENLFNSDELLYGVSSEYRVGGLQKALEYTLSDNKRLIIGNGWGQIEIEMQGEVVKGGGNDFVNVLGFSGVLGILGYLIYSTQVFFTFFRASRETRIFDQKLLAAGLQFAFIGIFVTAQMVGYLITPEYWTLIGIAIYVSMTYRRKFSVKKRNSLNSTPVFTH